MIALSSGNIAVNSWENRESISILDINNDFICIHILHGHESNIKLFKKLPNRNFVTCSNDGSIRIRDINDNYKCIQVLHIIKKVSIHLSN